MHGICYPRASAQCIVARQLARREAYYSFIALHPEEVRRSGDWHILHTHNPMTTPPDYNPHIHGHSPRTRVERLAWEHRDSDSVNTRQAAATVLVMAGCLHSHQHAVLQCGSFMTKQSRRLTIAHHARKLRRYVHCDHPRTEQGNRTWLTAKPDGDSAKGEAACEGRIVPTVRPDFLG